MWFIILYLFIGETLSQESIDPPTVNISQGIVIGTYNEYYHFYGIPYADSTSGINRFKGPRPPPNFQTPFIANRNDVKCVRATGQGFEGTEDCLVVNVFTPTLNQTSRLPVMVWVKGNEFDGVLEPEISFKRFMDKDVVVVSLNYRESILGFLCLGNSIAPGNAGLKDIIAALQWIRQNIIAFGGDPENVTIFGHGSGAAAVDLITLSQMSIGLVNSAISQSGTAMTPWAVTRDNLKYALIVANALGHTVTDIEMLSDIFTRVSVSALMAVLNDLNLTDNSMAFAPCLEREINGTVPFLTKSPHEILSSGEQLNIPFLTGFVDIEGTIRYKEAIEDDWLEKMDQSFPEFVQSDLIFESEEQEQLVVKDIRNFYFGNSSININSFQNYLYYHGDTMITVSAIREAKKRAVSSNASVYLYQFSYKSPLGSIFVGPLNVNGAAHNEELGYLFYEDVENETTISTNDLAVSDILVERWTNFAKTGNPKSETSSVQWRPLTSNNTYYLRILDDEEVHINDGGSLDIALQNPQQETLTFWEQIYENYFNDAKSRWGIDDRIEDDNENEEDDENEETDNENEEDDGGNTEEDNGNEDADDGNEDDDNGNESGNDGGNGAVSTTQAVSTSLVIITIIKILSELHLFYAMS
ncbi:unnamed protein product [Leptidea sinapis]|uniref:Carboxylesterase type B domain-containing protein n=1 Tax=Leptidea sinapis TaxID=189913 RepID=A0A5E4PVW8_9NEOP|nr:unnamed protein product [Leptidea sinapis]